ncbi:MAG: hypothetical protein K2I36_01555 [Ureaplasma sp.]|nr:hypothetical protein [Ureaplasma sp.]MDE7222136.1 hypothetical protein [Ureaplasma sp.]
MKQNKTKPNHNKKIVWKIIVSVLTFGAIGGLIVGLAVDWNYPDWIFIAGSSTMQPLLEEISGVYKKSEISANSGGSTFGITSIVTNKKNIGMLSKDPDVSIAGLPGDPNVNGQYKNEWEEFGIKTVTIAQDAIGIIYKSNEQLDINNDNIQNFYKVFCGDNNITFKTLMPNSSNNQNFIPFARSGGGHESGTAEAFVKYNGLINGSETELKKVEVDGKDVWTILSNGDYNLGVQQTNESNLETWEVIKNYNGSKIPISYLSAGFILNNYNEITKFGFKVATYDNGQQLINSSTNKIDSKYNWYRPLNLLLRTNNIQNEPAISKFIEWLIGNLLFENSEVSKCFANIGFVKCNAETLLTMFEQQTNDNIINQLQEYIINNPNSNYDEFLKNKNITEINNSWQYFWKGDYIIYQAQEQERSSLQNYYGAIFK